MSEKMEREGTSLWGKIDPSNNVIFHLGAPAGPVLVLDKDGMTYKGQRIKDAGEAHRAWLDAMAMLKARVMVAPLEPDFKSAYQDLIDEAIKDERQQLLAELLKLKNGVGSVSEYVQGRWDMIGEFQDIILARGKKLTHCPSGMLLDQAIDTAIRDNTNAVQRSTTKEY